MDLTRLATLKQKLQTAREFSEVWRYFMDHFGDDPDFMALGEQTRDNFLEQAVSQIAAQLTGAPVTVASMILIRLPEHGFIHGSVVLGGRPGNVMYFEDIHMGLMGVAWSAETAEAKFVRFSGRQLRDNWSRSDN
jgi:hypothetical protein